jgi:hypothetical protein
MMQYLVAIIAFPLLLVGWVLVQQASRRFAKSHPEFGPAREEGGGCGTSCGCHSKKVCRKKGRTKKQR